ncbi:pro-corazonin-like [Aricia agestis]|uniref:pro-corazonin-like n=1 Tax=Aricia agestis TaxID=91739 RepID=UPI001C209709|nr:pro-corazonin-like [Aricia agestis]
MLMNLSVFLIMITLSSVAAQTFQYSRGWKNGKRDGSDTHLDINRLEKTFSPCRMQKLQYLLDGKVTEKLLTPCEYLEEEEEPRRQKLKIAQNSYNFQ